MRKLAYIYAIQEALSEELASSEEVFLLGESVRGGVYMHRKSVV